MPLQDQVVPIHFGQGIQSKTDPKLVPAGPVLRLQDALFGKGMAINKRNGYNKLTKNILGGGTLSATPNMVSELNDELVCADSGQLYAYSPDLACWINRGPYAPFKTSIDAVSRSIPGLNAGTINGVLQTPKAAYLGNYALIVTQYTYQVNSGTNYIALVASIYDMSNGQTLLGTQLLASTFRVSSWYAVPFVLANTSLAVLGYDASNPTQAKFYVASISSSGVSFSTVTPGFADQYCDVQGTASGAVVMDGGGRSGAAAISLATLNAAGTATTHTASVDTGSYTVKVYSDPVNGNVWVYYVKLVTGAYKLYYAVYSSTLVQIVAPTEVDPLSDNAGSGAFAIDFRFSISRTSATTQTLYYSYLANDYSTGGPASNSESPYVTKTCTVNSSGTVGTPTVFKKQISLTSDVFSINGVSYIMGSYASATGQASYFTFRLSDGALVAKTLFGQIPSTVNSIVPPACTNVAAISSAKVGFPILQEIQGVEVNSLYGAPAWTTFDGGNIDLFQSVVANNNLALNGSQIYAYDGAQVTELGFHLAPQIYSIVSSGSGALTVGTYIYYATYQWQDDNGNVYESAPSQAVTYSNSTGHYPDIYYTLPTITNKTGVQVIIYRTVAGGTVPYRVAVLSVDSSAYYGDYLDKATSAVGSTVLYATGGILENSSPPPATAMIVKNNRLWALSDEAKNEVWYTKTFVATGGINFSGFLLEDVDISGDQINALAGLDEKIVYFSDNKVYITVGDGANDAGTGSTLSLPQQVPSDTGCSQSSGVITFPTGVMVKTSKGIYQLDRALNFHYFGAPVEGYNSQTVRASTLITDKTQIRFLCSDGNALVYDYYFGQWSTFTNHLGVSATTWNDSYAYLRTDGNIYVEAPGHYLDDTTSYGVLIQTAWLKFGSVQGLERVRQLLMLGEYTNGSSSLHGIQCSFAYDFHDSSFSAVNPFYFSDITPYQFRAFLPQQKCDSVSVLIQELVTGDSAEYVTFTDMSVLAGVKKGTNKIKAAASVG